MVVHGSANPLLTAEIAFSCLYGNVPEKELDLIQFSTRYMAQFRARTSQIMGRYFVIDRPWYGRRQRNFGCTRSCGHRKQRNLELRLGVGCNGVGGCTGTAYLSSNTITGNNVGVDGSLINANSRGNNTIVTNGTDVVSPMTPFSAQ